MTGWSDIITAAMTIIDDARWRDDLATNPAVFFRAKSDYIRAAMPKLNRPPELYTMLKTGMVEPNYDEYEWTSDAASLTGETAVSTGKIGYSLCSVAFYNADKTKMTAYPDAAYDSETGIVTFPQQSAAGIAYTIDFYTDGTFPELTPAQTDLFVLAVAIVWDMRQDRNWLNLQMKIHDSSFKTANEGNYAEKINQRLMRNIQMFRDSMNKYEQDCAYNGRFQNGANDVALI